MSTQTDRQARTFFGQPPGVRVHPDVRREIAELLLSPVGLSLSTKLAPKAFQTRMVALFFLSVALGTAMSGVLAKLYASDHESAYFGIIGTVALLLGATLAVAATPIRRLMSGVH